MFTLSTFGMLAVIFFVHWFADWFAQPRFIANNKGKSIKYLGLHVVIYTLFMMIFGWKFAAVNGAIHFVVDYISSKITSDCYKKERWWGFFTTIGFDSYIHQITLLVTYFKFLA